MFLVLKYKFSFGKLYGILLLYQKEGRNRLHDLSNPTYPFSSSSSSSSSKPLLHLANTIINIWIENSVNIFPENKHRKMDHPKQPIGPHIAFFFLFFATVLYLSIWSSSLTNPFRSFLQSQSTLPNTVCLYRSFIEIFTKNIFLAIKF